ncbi:hypothetical protein CEW46_30425, partial [Bacillus cereus]
FEVEIDTEVRGRRVQKWVRDVNGSRTYFIVRIIKHYNEVRIYLELLGAQVTWDTAEDHFRCEGWI